MASHSSILDSWTENASEWISIIRQKGIDSRKVTNPAVVNTIWELHPASVLDLGCGEGWLTRALHQLQIPVIGVDGTDSLIQWARQQSNCPYQLISFEQLIAGAPILQAPFELIVLNFCLYESDATENLLRYLHQYLFGRKLVVIQTLHPITLIKNGMAYCNQWLEDSWAGLPGKFTSPHRWYFRTLEGWLSTFNTCHLQLLSITEPRANEQSWPASIIFTLNSIL